MNRFIFCTFLQKRCEGQDFQSYPGKLGKKIYNEISKIAWNKWLVQQTILINEKKLNMCNTQDRQKLEREMELFLFNKKLYGDKN